MSQKPLILVVDDDLPVLSSLTFVLESHGFAVCGCANACEAMAAQAGEAVCMIVDQLLPDLSGLDLLQALRARGVTAPAILITTAPSAVLRRSADLTGAAIVSKPLLGDELFQQIRRLAPGAAAA